MSDKLAMLRNVAIVAFASYVESAVGLLAGIVIARTLGPEEYGHYAYAVWLCGVLLLITNSALTTSSIKFLAELRGAQKLDLAHILVFKFQRWQMLAGMLVLAAFTLWSFIHPNPGWGDHFWPMLLITLVAVWARAGFWLLGALGKGFELFVPENLTLATMALLNLIVTGVLAWTGAGVIEFFASYAALGVVSNLMVRMMLRSGGITAAKGDLPEPLMVRVRKHLALTGVMITFSVLTNRAVEMTLLQKYVGSVAVGYFSIAGALSKGAVDLLAGGVSAVLLPSMARQYGAGGARALSRMLVESTRMYWFMGLAVSGLGLTVADGAIRVLYGERYVAAIPALQWQLLMSGLVVMNGAAYAALTADDRQFARIVLIVSGFLFNALMGYLLIPTYGLNGAIASSLATQTFMTTIIWAYTLHLTRARLMIGAMSRLLLASACATGVSWSIVHLVLDSKWAFVPGGIVFLLLYLPLSVVFKTWRKSDFEVFGSLAQRAGAPGRRLAPKIAGLAHRFGVANAQA
ncbi:MAG: polysaccharide biosynthesis C-terminal domain-containing protein [Aquabacterium sp.]